MTTTTDIIKTETAQDKPRTLLSEELERYARTHADDVKRLAKLLSDQPGTTSTNRRFVSQRAIRDAIDGTRELVPNVLPYSDLPWIAICLETDVDPNDLPEPRKPRQRRKGLSVEAYREQQRQRASKLGGRTSMPQRELDEYATGQRKTYKTTADATTVYVTEGYVLHHGVTNRHHYYVDWRRGENSWDPRCELGHGIFSSDEDAIDYLMNTWSKSHRAYIPDTAMADTVPGPEETAAPTIEDEIIAATTTEETEAQHEDTIHIATSGQTTECEGLPYVRPSLCAESRGRTALGSGRDLRDAVDRHHLLALAY